MECKFLLEANGGLPKRVFAVMQLARLHQLATDILHETSNPIPFTHVVNDIEYHQEQKVSLEDETSDPFNEFELPMRDFSDFSDESSYLELN
jgi:hypothetical protein